MPKYVVCEMPDMDFDGQDRLDGLREAKGNDYHHFNFAVVKAKNMLEAREKYFYKVYLPKMEKEDVYAYASLNAWVLCEDYEKEDLVNKFGEEDGALLWEITTAWDEMGYDDAYYYKQIGYPFQNYYFDFRIKQVSMENLQKLVFMHIMLNFGVSEVIADIK